MLPESAAEFVVIHVGFGLPLAPAPGDLVGVGELEFAIGALPSDAGGVGRIREELQQKLPQLDLSRSLRNQSTAGRVQQLVWICGERQVHKLNLSASFSCQQEKC